MRRDSNPNLSWLTAFDAAARHRNFTKAADELGLTQGAISIQIRKLENALNTALFERRGRHVVLTDEGLAYHPHVSEALEALSASTARLFARNRRNVVTISCFSPTFASLWIAPRLPRLMADIPEVEINMMIDYQANGVRGDRDDLVFTYEQAASSTFIPLVQEHLMAVCAPSYLEQHKENWGRGILIELAGPRSTWSAWRAATGAQVKLDGRVLQVNAMTAALDLARAGSGAALIAQPFAKAALEAGELAEILPGKRLPGKFHGLSSGQLENARPLTKRVAGWLLHEGKQRIPDYLGKA
ncbi:MAG: LysR family transcriptional regulator [Rhodobacteraceae bacterium]|nr:LysR family transcriptional regulator [Paracoccaceae bacterium]